MYGESIYTGEVKGKPGANHPSSHIAEGKEMSVDTYLRNLGMNSAYSRNDTYGGNVNGLDAEMATFNRYGVLFADDEMSSSLGYVFMVRPDLNIVYDASGGMSNLTLSAETGADLYLAFLSKMDPTILMCLTQLHTGGYHHQFIPILYDRVDEYQIPNVELATHEMTQPFSGFKTIYAGNSNGSQTGCQFEIGFRESADLRVTKLFQAWINYINGIALNLFRPKDKYLQAKYTDGSQVIDYATSIYFIRTKPDGEIIFFHKVTGAFPTQVPLSQQSYNRGGSPDNKITVSFTGGYPESMNPITMAEFNWNSLGDLRGANITLAPHYNKEGFGGNSCTGDLFTGSPLIFRSTDGRNKFYLAWQKYEATQSNDGYKTGQGEQIIPNNVPAKRYTSEELLYQNRIRNYYTNEMLIARLKELRKNDENLGKYMDYARYVSEYFKNHLPE